MTLKPPYANNIALEFWDGNVLRSYLYFGAYYSAQRFLDAVIDKAKYKWVSRNRIMIPRYNGMTIWCTELQDVMEHKLTSEEKQFKLTAPYDGFAARLRGGEKVATPRIAHNDETNAPANAQDMPKRQRSVNAPRLTGDGVSLATIATQLDMHMSKARAIMRKHHIEKPYAWDDAAPIIKLLKGK